MKKPKVIKRNPTTRSDSTAMNKTDSTKTRLIQLRRHMVGVLHEVDAILGLPHRDYENLMKVK